MTVTDRTKATVLAVIGTVILVGAMITAGPALTLAVVGGGAAGGWAVVALRRHPEALAVVIVTFFALQPALKFFFSRYFGPAKDGLVILAVALWASRVWNRRSQLRDRDFTIVLLVCTLLGIYVLNVAGSHGAAWLDGTRLVIEGFSLFLMALGELDAKRVLRYGLVALVAVGAAEAAYGLFQQAVGFPWLVHHLRYAFGNQVRTTPSGNLRSFGTFNDAFSYGSFELLALVAGMRWRPRTWAWSAYGLRCLLVVGVSISFVRTDWVILAVLGIVALCRSVRSSAWPGFLGAAAVAAMAVLVALSGTHVAANGSAGSKSFLLSLNGRTLVWGKIVPTPWVLVGGDGVGTFGSGLARSQVQGIVPEQHYVPGQKPVASSVGNVQSIDSSYLATVADVGLPGLLLLLGILFRLSQIYWRASRRGDARGWTGLGFLAVVSMDCLTRTSLTAFPSGYIYLYLLGAVAAGVLADAPDRASGASYLGDLSKPEARRANPAAGCLAGSGVPATWPAPTVLALRRRER